MKMSNWNFFFSFQTYAKIRAHVKPAGFGQLQHLALDCRDFKVIAYQKEKRKKLEEKKKEKK